MSSYGVGVALAFQLGEDRLEILPLPQRVEGGEVLAEPEPEVDDDGDESPASTPPGGAGDGGASGTGETG